jgi:ectoine hydroxylase-related dioxygenase (phytanoyl-CoA dioxygenase family)
VRAHPWTGDFRWEDRRGPFRRLSEEQVAAFDRDGFVVLPDVFDAERTAAIRDEIDGFEAATEEALRGRRNQRQLIAEAGAITFTTHLVARSAALRAFALDEVFADLCHDLIGPDANLYWDQAVYKKPEKPRRFPWHQDNGYQFVDPQQYLTCWVALTDATQANGCPQVARGLHRQGTLLHEYVDPLGFECCTDPDDVAVAQVGAGGVVVFSSLTPHLTGPNTTEQVRKAYILQYAPAGARLLHGDAGSGPPTAETPADAADRQPPILRDGRHVAPAR